MQLSCRLVPPPTLNTYPKEDTFSKKPPGCRHANLVSTLGVMQCNPPPPAPTPLKNPSYAPAT